MPGVGVRAGAGPGQEAEGGVARAPEVGGGPDRAGSVCEGLIPRGAGPSFLWQGLRNVCATINAEKRGFADSSLEYAD